MSIGLDLVQSSDEPVNITKKIRLENDMGLQTFAGYAGVSQQIVLRTDQGVYADIPISILTALLELSRITSNDLKIKYAQYIKEHRLWAQAEKPLNPNHILHADSPLHPLVSWRILCGYESRMSFCTAFCLHSSTITRFEAGEAKSVPHILKELFLDIYDTDQAMEVYRCLDFRFQKWLSNNSRVA